ncbi:hypothetical protein DV738_g785, partial [Chaetothyriales sp. CBS 135597]
MSCRYLFLLGLLAAPAVAAPALDGRAVADGIDYGAAAISISALLASPSFVPYTRPNQAIEEFIALGDSYTAGTGSNGLAEQMAGEAVRGQRAYPMQMSTDEDNWRLINNGGGLPRFSFHAYTGASTAELITEQLKKGDYQDDKNLPRSQPFGKPQVAVLTIGWIDATFSHILNNCLLRLWRPGDCQESLDALYGEIDNGSLREKITYALFEVANAGRQAGGANPRVSFQVYVLEYPTFFSDAMSPECDSYTWTVWSYLFSGRLRLTTSLRTTLNDLIRKLNGVIKDAAQYLEPMGVIYVEGINDVYEGHRYCEPGANSNQTEDNVWFWSPYSDDKSVSEGLSYDVLPYRQLRDFIYPNRTPSLTWGRFESLTPPWQWAHQGASKYPDLLSLMYALRGSGGPSHYLRSFHPKGTAYREHARLLFAAMADNRDVVSAPGSRSDYSLRCTDWSINDNRFLVGTCTNKDGQGVKTQADLSLGYFSDDCSNCWFNYWDLGREYTLWCACRDDADSSAQIASIKLDDLVEVQDDGHVKCFDHVSAPA